MQPTKQLIAWVLLLLALWIPQKAICSDDTGVDTLKLGRPFSFDILPEIERDLKICDLIRTRSTLLESKVVILDSQLLTAKSETAQAKKGLKKEKRKRIIQNVIRTTIEIVVIVAVLTI